MPGTVNTMETEREVVCGADIHKHFLLATILTKDGQKFQDRFDSNFEGLLNFRQWLLDHDCQRLVHHNTSFKFYTFAIIWHGNEEGVCS